MPEENDLTLTMRIPRELKDRLRRAAIADDRSMASFIRRIAEAELERREASNERPRIDTTQKESVHA